MCTNNEDIDMDYFITLVQEREIFWDKSNVDFKNKTLKAKSWEQIAKILFPEYDNFSSDKKNQIGNDIVKKWRSVKDNFYKYLKKIKDASKSGSGAKKLKKYHFYNQLLFLTKVTQNETDSSLDVTEQANTDSTSDIAPETSRYVPISRKRTMQVDDFEKEALKALKEPENRHMSFFKGILPSIQDFTELQTLTFQSKVLQIITEMRYGPMSQSSSSYGFQQTSHQPLSHGCHTSNYRSTYTPTDLEMSSSEISQESEYDFANL